MGLSRLQANTDKERGRCYIAIDLKSYYASAECVSRGLDPLGVNLVVADSSRTEKTICLAVSPSLKAYGIPGRARLFEVVQRVNEINAERLSRAVKEHKAVMHEGRPDFRAESYVDRELKRDAGLKLSYIVAPPRMSYYVETSAMIYGIYLKYVSPDDILVYSIDEVFIDATPYLSIYNMTAQELAMSMIHDILETTGITATAGIGTNLYLAKLAMDIMAKHTKADSNGVRMAELNEQSFRQQLWSYRPLTAFWMTGPGTVSRLAAHGIYTMGDIARQSLKNQEWFYKTFGVDAEILIDHAWGLEPCGLSEIKRYKPSTTSLSEGQVLACPYSQDKAAVVVREMADSLVLQLTEREMTADGLTMDISYDRENCDNGSYRGAVRTDHYGRTVPKGAHGSVRLGGTALGSRIIPAVMRLYEQITDSALSIRRINLALTGLSYDSGCFQMDIFSDAASMEKEMELQRAMIRIKHRFGKNAVLKGTDYIDGATMRERNAQIGGHRA